MSERIKAGRVAEMTGLSLRSIQKMAPKIPSAARLGKLWTFREDAVRRWVANKEEETWQGTSTVAAGPGGAGFSLPRKSYAEAYERHLRPKPKRGSPSGRPT